VQAAVVRAGATLEEALASYLAHEGPGVVVTDHDGKVLGVLTPGQLLSGARRSSRPLTPR
jgi:hypothetical protein